MYRIETTIKGSLITLHLFDEDMFEVWKFKDNWEEDLKKELSRIGYHDNFKLIRNKDDAVLAEKKINNKWFKQAIYYRRNFIYETVRKDIGFDYYKKDEYGLTYKVIPINKGYRGICVDADIEGDIKNTEAKAFTAIKQQMYKKLLLMGLDVLIKNNKRKK